MNFSLTQTNRIIRNTRYYYASYLHNNLKRLVYLRPQIIYPSISNVYLKNYHLTRLHFKENQIVSSPAFPDSVSEGDIRWIKNIGDEINIDDIVCEIETDKTAIPIPSPHKGFLISRLVEEGGKVKAHQNLFLVGSQLDMENPSTKTHEADIYDKTQMNLAPNKILKASDVHHVVVSVPQLPESVTEGYVKWIKKVGDFMDIDEPLCEIETDKTAVPIPSPIKGVLLEIKVDEGSKVSSKTPLCVLSASEASSQSSQQGIPVPSLPDKPYRNVLPLSPNADLKNQPNYAHADFTKTDQTDIPSGTKRSDSFFPPLIGGSEETDRSAPQRKISTQIRIDESGARDITRHIGGTRTESKVKMNRMRKRIAERLKQAQNTAAMLTTFNEVDMSAAIALREKHKESFTKAHAGLKLGFVSIFVLASAKALCRQPIVNAFVAEDNDNIMYRDYVDISVAVATPKGLVVPVIRNCEHMNIADIEKNLALLGDKARKGTLAIEDMDGGTFTISNGGVFGSLMGTPIINLPQSAILGVHAIQKRPIAINDKVEIRPMMYVALTYDHRLIDGREAVTFLKTIKNYVEDPASIFLDL